jgi:hypothetical protein
MLAHEFELFDIKGGKVSRDESIGSERGLCNDRGQPLRKLSLIVSEDGDAGMKIAPGEHSPEVRARLEDNTPDSLIMGYIASAIARGKPEFRPGLCRHDGTMVIVGSGPSVAEHIEDIRAEQARGKPVMAIKGAHDWLIDRGVIPDLWVSMDSQDKIVEGVRHRSRDTCYLVASKVSPVVYDWLEGAQVITWHAWMGKGGTDHFPKDSHLIGGGSTSGLRGITLAWLMGFQRVILFGFDSCLKDGAKRVNGDKPQGQAIPIQVGVSGPPRICDGSMASQALEFQHVTFSVMPGLKVKVVGDGLFADIMAERKRLGFNDW